MSTSTSATQTSAIDRPHPYRSLIRIGLAATLVAMTATTLAAALARAIGVDFQLAGATEPIPLPGFATMTAVFSLIGMAIATALLRWTTTPAKHFTRTAITLTAVSLLAPLLSGGDAATTITLISLHLIAAAVMIPALTSAVRRRP